jgi:hypothetical protein
VRVAILRYHDFVGEDPPSEEPLLGHSKQLGERATDVPTKSGAKKRKNRMSKKEIGVRKEE